MGQRGYAAQLQLHCSQVDTSVVRHAEAHRADVLAAHRQYVQRIGFQCHADARVRPRRRHDVGAARAHHRPRQHRQRCPLRHRPLQLLLVVHAGAGAGLLQLQHSVSHCGVALC